MGYMMKVNQGHTPEMVGAETGRDPDMQR